nr:SH3 domain-containing protein [Lachnospiraceae bacterium]
GEATEETAATTNTSFAVGDKLTLTQTVNVRESMSETASKVAVAYAGETGEIVMSYQEGWTKVKYDGTTGYIKTDLLQ